MKNTLLNPSDSKMDYEQQKKQVMFNIKEIQRDMIKASFQKSSGNLRYEDLLQSINDERALLKSLNQKIAQLNT